MNNYYVYVHTYMHEDEVEKGDHPLAEAAVSQATHFTKKQNKKETREKKKREASLSKF